MRSLRNLCLMIVLIGTALACHSARAETLAGAQAKLADPATEANAFFSLSFFFEQSGRPFSALRAIEKAIEKDGNVPGYFARQGQLLLTRKRTREAATAYGRAADMDPATKSFRAAQARALVSCSMFKEGAAAWEQLLVPATDSNEILDAARNVAELRRKTGDLEGAEKAWQTAFEKLANWNERLQAADAESGILMLERAEDRAVAFWGAWQAKETVWQNRATLAGRMAACAQSAASAEAHQHIRAAWTALLDSAPDTASKQSAAGELCALLLKDNQYAEALQLVMPLVYGPPAVDLRLAALADAALSEQNDTAAQIKLWRGVIDAKPDYAIRSEAITRLAPLLKDPAAITALRRDAVVAFPKEPQPQLDLAQALGAEKKFAEAAETTYSVFSQARAGNTNNSRLEIQYWDAVVNAFANAQDTARLAKVMGTEFQGLDAWRMQSWMNSVQSICGEAPAIALAEQLAAANGTNGMVRLGAAQYLLNAYPDRARVLLDAIGNDTHLPVEDRRQALERLDNYATSPAEHVSLLQRSVNLGGDFWRRWNAYNQLGMYMGMDGQIAEGIEMVRGARKILENNQSPAPQALRALGSGTFQNQLVGRGLRSTEGLVAAIAATTKLYQEASGDPFYQGCFDDLCRNLAELKSRRGDTAGAIDLLHAFCGVRENPALRLAAADLISRRSGNNTDALWAEYLAYIDATRHLYAEGLRANNRNHYFTNLEERVVKFIAKEKKEQALADHFDALLNDKQNGEREATADLLLSYQRGNNAPADMVATLTRLKTLGITGWFYDQQRQWADAAVKLNNAGSRADAQRREQLLKDVDTWKGIFAANPEDYQAAVNIYKSLQSLGRTTDGRPFLEQALNVAPTDPLVLEIHARELMLDKAYGEAAKELKLAATNAGRIDDVEATIAQAYELSGHSMEAIKLSLDALERGVNNGQGIRSTQELQDLAERTNALDFLKTELTQRMQAANERKRLPSELMASLALNVAWERDDTALATLAVDAVLTLAWQPSYNRLDEWQWQQLAQRAQERRHLEDAIRIHQALQTAKTNRHDPPNEYEYQNLATLMLQAGHADDAAELMFGALAQASRPAAISGDSAQPVLWNAKGNVRRDERHRPQPNRPVAHPAGSDRRAWIAGIFSIAAREVDGGADTFRKASGERFAALIDEELKDVADSGLVNVQNAVPLGLRERVESALRDASQAPTATADTWVSLAAWRMTLADYESDHKLPRTVKLEDIIPVCKSAIDHAADMDKLRISLAIANLYQAQFNRAADLRIPGFTPELVLSAYDATATLEALRPALQFAKNAGLSARCLSYAQQLLATFPDSFADATTLADAHLLMGDSASAAGVLKPYLESRDQEAFYTQAAQLFLVPRGEKSDAGTWPLAAEYFQKAIALHRIAVGTQLDAQGKVMPDLACGELQSWLCTALARSGKFDASLTALSDAAANDAYNPWQHDRIVTLAEIFKKAGKLGDLASALETNVSAQPRNVALRLACADVAEISGDAAAALDALSVAKAISPDLSTVKRLIAQQRKMGKNSDALAECKVWSANFASDEEAHQTLAAIYKDLHDDARELQALTMLVESAPREAVQCRKVAVMFAARKDYVRARSLLERAVELRSEEPYRVIDLAEVCFLAGDFARAEQLCTDALARDWTKGLSPALLARMPRWKGTFEDRAHAILADAYQSQQQTDKAAHERMLLPPNYQRPTLADAVPMGTPNGVARPRM